MREADAKRVGEADEPRRYIRISRPALWRLIAAKIVILVLLLASYPSWLGLVAKVLVVEQPLKAADAILVLGGGAGEREEWGAELYSKGYAPRLITSGESPHIPGEARTFAEISATMLQKLGIPTEAISQMPETTSTYDEAVDSLALMQKWGGHTLIVVTDPYHTRRSFWTFRHVYRRQNIELVFSGTPYSWFNLKRWWTRERDFMAVVGEYEKGFYYLLKGRFF